MIWSVLASFGTPDCKGFSPELLQVRAHRLVRRFPHQEGLAAQDFARLRDLKGWNCEDHGNYASFCTDSSKIAADEITRIEHKGFFRDLHRLEVTERCPNAVASKVAVLLKTREEGTTKVRLIIDLRRSGGNGGIELPERVVLPRLSDLTTSILELMVCDSETMEVQQGESIDYDLSVVDFEDAFRTLAIREQDRGVMAIRTHEGWAVFKRLCCGMAAAQLVWCRVSAAAARLGQACFRPNELRLQIFVDDPAHVGRRNSSVVVLVRSRFHSQLAQSASWLLCALDRCAQVTLKEQNGKWGTLTELVPAKVQDTQGNVDQLFKTKGMVDI